MLACPFAHLTGVRLCGSWSAALLKGSTQPRQRPPPWPRGLRHTPEAGVRATGQLKAELKAPLPWPWPWLALGWAWGLEEKLASFGHEDRSLLCQSKLYGKGEECHKNRPRLSAIDWKLGGMGESGGGDGQQLSRSGASGGNQ